MESISIIIPLNSAPIQSKNVREFVRKRIDFPLTNDQWLVIDQAMAKYWNNRVKGTWICNKDNAKVIFDYCIEQKVLISYDRILQITDKIWEYLEIMGRLTDE